MLHSIFHTRKQIREILDDDNEIDYVVIINDIVYDVTGFIESIKYYAEQFDYPYVELSNNDVDNIYNFLTSEITTRLYNRIGYVDFYVDNFYDLLPSVIDVYDEDIDMTLVRKLNVYIGEKKIMNYWLKVLK